MNHNASKAAPVAKKVAHVRRAHDYEFVDNYEWMRDKDSVDTQAYLEAENAYTEFKTAHLATLQDNLFTELKSRVQETDMSVPVRVEEFWYYDRIDEGQSYGRSCRVRADLDPRWQDPWNPPEVSADVPIDGEEVLLDREELAKEHEFFSLGGASVAKGGRYMAYATDTSGDERYDLRIKDLNTGELLPDAIDGMTGNFDWLGDNYLFYTRCDESWRPYQVWRHVLGTPASEDQLVYEEPDERFWIGVGASRSEKFMFIVAGSKLTSETRVLDFADPTGTFSVVKPREEGVEYDVSEVYIGDTWWWMVTHNAHGPNSELGLAPIFDADGSFAQVDLEQLTVLVEHRPDVRLQGVDTFKKQAILGYRESGVGKVALLKLPERVEDIGSFTPIEFDEELYSAGFAQNPEWDSPVLRMVYGSFTTPACVMNFDVATGQRTVLKQQEVLGGYNPADYLAERVWVSARDGAQIPVSLVRRADLDVSVAQPTMLYGYGSYEACVDPSFSCARLSMLDRGMIIAYAHVRGGGEMGRLWYDDGKIMKKRNTFTDFIDVADALLERGVTTREQLVADGGSAGGLLMGAVANMGGDRFKAISANVPFVDPLTSMLMPELPLTVAEWEEWGDPLHSKEVYDYMATYAPYENIEAKPYPNILATTSLNDTRVLYVEPAKWIAKLRDLATAGEFLLKTEMAAGHGGVSGRYESWRQDCFERAWIINQATGLEV